MSRGTRWIPSRLVSAFWRRGGARGSWNPRLAVLECYMPQLLPCLVAQVDAHVLREQRLFDAHVSNSLDHRAVVELVLGSVLSLPGRKAANHAAHLFLVWVGGDVSHRLVQGHLVARMSRRVTLGARAGSKSSGACCCTAAEVGADQDVVSRDADRGRLDVAYVTVQRVFAAA